MVQSRITVEAREQLIKLVTKAAPTELATFNLYWQLIGTDFESILEQGLQREKGLRWWMPGAAPLSGSAGENLVIDLMSVFLNTLREARKSDEKNPDVSRIVSTFVREIQSIAPYQKDIEDSVMRMLSKPHVVEQKYEVLTNNRQYLANLGDVRILRGRKHEFQLWWDRELGEILVNGQPKLLRAQLQKLLGLVLEYSGKMLTDETICLRIWDDQGYDASRPIDQLFSELYAAIRAIGSQDIRAARGLNARKVEIKISYCSLRPVEQS